MTPQPVGPAFLPGSGLVLEPPVAHDGARRGCRARKGCYDFEQWMARRLLRERMAPATLEERLLGWWFHEQVREILKGPLRPAAACAKGSCSTTSTAAQFIVVALSAGSSLNSSASPIRGRAAPNETRSRS